MGNIRQTPPVKLFVAQLVAADAADQADAIDRKLESRFGAIDLKSQTWPFDFTDYYTPEMGPNLSRRIVSFETLIDPAELVEAKKTTNDLEADLTRRFRPPGAGRAVNLDPGYLSLGQILLATTKSYSHRVYLREGIWAEVTLRYRRGRYDPWDWTYPDYADGRYNEFWLRMRDKLKHAQTAVDSFEADRIDGKSRPRGFP